MAVEEGELTIMVVVIREQEVQTTIIPEIQVAVKVVVATGIIVVLEEIVVPEVEALVVEVVPETLISINCLMNLMIIFRKL